jgi:hypothetical protein
VAITVSGRHRILVICGVVVRIAGEGADVVEGGTKSGKPRVVDLDDARPRIRSPGWSGRQEEHDALKRQSSVAASG